MPNFRVYFDQVNQTRYDVEATDRDKAIAKAERYWIEDYGRPTGAHVEQEKEPT